LKLYNPAPGRKITSPYGPRRHPITGEFNKMHHGTDFGGTFRVLAAQDGIVEHIGWSPNGGGHVVIIKHASNLYTVYYHGREATQLKKGDRVRAGDFIYMSGNTGASNGAHLHLEVRRSRRWGDTIDPMSMIVDGNTPEPDNTVSEAGLKVDGKLEANTWRAWQEVLKAKYGYRGIVDGRPGKMTWEAVQRSTGKHYTGAIDGIPGPLTRKAVQKKLKDLKEYDGKIDGIWGRGTIGALQRALNARKY
jgi:murein DD-endopeptidase MepM/ murein hydrolase activator NlpD